MMSRSINPSVLWKTNSTLFELFKPRKFVTSSFKVTVFPFSIVIVSASRKSSLFVRSVLSTDKSFVCLVVNCSKGSIETTDQKKSADLPKRFVVKPALMRTDYVQRGTLARVLDMITVGGVMSPPVRAMFVNCVVSFS